MIVGAELKNSEQIDKISGIKDLLNLLSVAG